MTPPTVFERLVVLTLAAFFVVVAGWFVLAVWLVQ